jgi:hypothetical protein
MSQDRGRIQLVVDTATPFNGYWKIFGVCSLDDIKIGDMFAYREAGDPFAVRPIS